MGTGRRFWVKVIAWLLWFFLLTATPYHLAEPYRGPVLTGFYGWVSLGLFLGCCVVHFWRQAGSRFAPQSADGPCGFLSSRALGIVAVIGFCLALLFCIPEWALLPLAYQVDPETMYSLSDWVPSWISDWLPQPLVTWRVAIENVGGVCLLVSGFLCAVSLFVLVGPDGSRPGRDCSGLQQREKGELFGLSVSGHSAERLVRYATPILLFAGFALGALGQMVDYYSFHIGVLDDPYRLLLNASTDAAWASVAPLPSVVLPGAAALLMGLGCILFGVWGKEGKGWPVLVADERLWVSWDWGLFAEKLLAFYCLGALGWNFLSRSTAYVYSLISKGAWQASVVLEATILGLFAAIALGLLIAPRLQGRAGTEPQSFNRENESGDRVLVGDSSISRHVATVELAAIFGEPEVSQLSERELEAVQNHLACFSSADSAERMGLKAPTVRAYLQRAYRKLGVADGEELRRIVSAATNSVSAEADDMTPVEGSGSDEGRAKAEKLLAALARCAACLALPIVLLVTGFLDCDVYLSRVLPFGCGLGFMIVAVVIWGGRRLGGHTFAKSLIALAGIAVFVITSIGAAWAGAVVAGMGMALFILAAAGACLTAIVLLAPYGGRQSGDAYVFGRDERTGLLLLAVSACVGMVFQAQWFLPDAPIAGMLIPACLILTWALAWVLFAKRTWGNVVLVLSLIAFFLDQSSAFVEMAVILALWTALLARVHFSPLWQSGCLLCLGAGMSFGRLASNVVNDLTKTNSWLFDQMSPESPLFLMIGFGVSVAVLLVVGWIAFSFYRSMQEEKRVGEWRASNCAFDEQRAKAYFTAKGLNETQSAIAAKLAMGLLAAEISETYYFSRATIDQARTIAYSTMHVHDQASFIGAVNRELTSYNSTN